jgi:hypothetical protein
MFIENRALSQHKKQEEQQKSPAIHCGISHKRQISHMAFFQMYQLNLFIGTSVGYRRSPFKIKDVEPLQVNC